ncbi:MAG TPA: hypothetical protein VI322_04935 [Candidatus Saccharimonadia bacterium]
MRAPSKVLTLVLAAAFVVTPQLVLAFDGPGGFGDNISFATPTIPLPTNVSSLTDGSGRRTFVANTASPSGSPRVRIEGAMFCNRFTDATGGVSSDLANRFNQLQTQFQQRGDKIKGDFKTVTDTQTNNRSKADAGLAAKFAELEVKATTDDQKAAVTEFEAAIKAAVAARRAAVDAADNTFKQGLLDANATRQAALKAAAADYRAAVQAALDAAKASCAAGTSPATVRDTLKSALDAARAKLEAARKAAGKGDTNLDALKAARKAAVDKANADFRAAVKAALTKLRAALGTATPSPVDTTTATPTP